MFHFNKDSRKIIKHAILKSIGRFWKETRNRLYYNYYDSEKMIKQHIEKRLPRISADHWRWFFHYHNSNDTQEKCRKSTVNRSKQLYTHTDGSKSLARCREKESELQGKKVGRGELWISVYERRDGSYIHEEARTIGNDSLAQTLRKEHPSRVRGVNFEPTSSQLFGTTSHQPGNGVQREETQRDATFSAKCFVKCAKIMR
ncbi:hypothetical protein Ahy_B03g066937 [Arachis hypogaea]|uniref:Uncharacterized protein n=1 Tax=Arachis hypogaea TaxID=3818 RepID=A0A445A5E4_ARAHY|nr:hypothetical protein Ahy_B03g066937 [Arachis hypogaea]